MRKAKYSLKQVICPKASCIGYSSNVAKPGYWVAWQENGREHIGRVLGRIDESERARADITYGRAPTLPNCAGFLACIRLSMELTHAGIAWVDPQSVTACYARAPAQLLAWITGDAWVKNKADIARIIAMSQHGTTSEEFIATRDDPAKPYNSRPDTYNSQYILE